MEDIMSPRNDNWSRRDFLKGAGIAGVGSVVAPIQGLAESYQELQEMPTRTFGKTGVKVPVLSFGGSMDVRQLLLHQALKWGVTYWDTANTYYGGNSERQIGNILYVISEN